MPATYTPISAKKMLRELANGSFVLPAMQRKFVWDTDRIAKLFDSLLSGYPIGTLLLWEITEKNKPDMIFYNFSNSYSERTADGKKPKKGDAVKRGDKLSGTDLVGKYAILDGQQRTTALLLGLSGDLEFQIKGGKNPEYAKKALCLDIFHLYNPDDEDDEPLKYLFDFKTQNEQERFSLDSEQQPSLEWWVPASKALEEEFDYDEYFSEEVQAKYYSFVQEKSEQDLLTLERRKGAKNALKALQTAFANEDTAFSSFYSTSLALEQVIEVFVRINSQGQKLSSVDLMLSMASADQGIDTQALISQAITDIKEASGDADDQFTADNQLLLRAGLMFRPKSDNVSLTKKTNYTIDRLNYIFKESWEAIIESLCNGVKLLRSLHFEVGKLSTNLLLPVAYYLYINKLGTNYITSTLPDLYADKNRIAQFIVRGAVKSLFRDGTGSTLIAIKRIIDLKGGNKRFPLEAFYNQGFKRSLRITSEDIEKMLLLQYGDATTRALLLLMTRDGVTGEYRTYQIDHIWAQDILNKQTEIKKYYPTATPDDCNKLKRQKDRFANLQLLTDAENFSKKATTYDKWIETFFANEEKKYAEYCDTRCINPNSPRDLEHFLRFCKDREVLMRKRLEDLFEV